MIKYLAIVALACALLGCSDSSTPDPAGQQLLISDLGQNPGYAWYQTEIGSYTPDPAMVDSVKSHFGTDEKVCIFVRPSCGCRGTQKLFPRVMKTLMDANVDLSKVEIWSMRNPSDNTPYDATFSLTSLPTIVVMRNGAEVSRIIDADFNEVNADTLIASAILK